VVAGALPFFADSDADSVDSRVGVAVLLLDSNDSLAPEVGDTSAGDGGVDTPVVSWLDVDGVGLVELCSSGDGGLCVSDATGAGVLADGTSRGASGAALVAIDDGAGSGARVSVGVSTVGGGSGSRVGGGASTVSGTGGATVTGAGATADGMSATVGFSTGACFVASTVGCGATVVVGPTGSVPGFAKAGATPPVSAVSEMTTPVAKTAQTVRLRQISNGAPIVHRLLRSRGA
jgi:hypothetical protein